MSLNIEVNQVSIVGLFDVRVKQGTGKINTVNVILLFWAFPWFLRRLAGAGGPLLGPDYMSRAGPVSRAGSVCRDDFQPGFSMNDQSTNDLFWPFSGNKLFGG